MNRGRAFCSDAEFGDSPFRPLDERGRNFVAHDHHAQDAIVVEEDRGGQSGGLNGRVTRHAAGTPVADPPLIVAISLNIFWLPETVSFRRDSRRCLGLHSTDRSAVTSFSAKYSDMRKPTGVR